MYATATDTDTDTVDDDDDAAATRSANPWSFVLIAGLVALALDLIAIQCVSRAIIAPIAIFTIVFAGLAAAVHRSMRRRIRLVAATAASILLIANLPFAVEDLQHPESFGGFVPTMVAVTASTLVVVAGIVASTRRAPGAARPAGAVTLAIVTLASVGAAIASAAVDDGVEHSDDVTVVARDIEFPEELDLPPGESVLVVDNHDHVRHTLLIEGTGVDVELPASTARRIPVDLDAGTYFYYCDVLGHENMHGTIVVEP